MDYANFMYDYIKHNISLDITRYESKFKQIQMHEILKVQFDKINLYNTEGSTYKFYNKDLIEIFYDIYMESIVPNINSFIIDYKDIKFARAANVKDGSVERLTPNTKFRALNRWNPKDRFYCYLGIERDGDSNRLLKTC